MLSGRAQTVEHITPTQNERHSIREFSIPPQELFSFFKMLRRSSRELVGIYHSHPDSEAVPSPRDVTGFHYAEASYWIVSLKRARPDIHCFRWVKMGFKEVAFTVIREHSPLSDSEWRVTRNQ